MVTRLTLKMLSKIVADDILLLFLLLLFFRENVRLDISCEPYARQTNHEMNMKPYFLAEIQNKKIVMLSAAIVISPVGLKKSPIF